MNIRLALLLQLVAEPSHGYGLIARLGAMGIYPGTPSTVYRTLRLMEAEGLLRSDWSSDSAGPARRVYQTTATTTAYLSEHRDQVEYECRMLGTLRYWYDTLMPR